MSWSGNLTDDSKLIYSYLMYIPMYYICVYMDIGEYTYNLVCNKIWL